MATEKRRVERVIDDKGGKVQVLFETSAEQVTIADTDGEFKATNVEDALKEVMEVAKTGGVTGVKGDAESEYRKGNVNITKANIGLGSVDNTPDTNKPVSTPQQNALDKKVDKTTTVNGHALSGDIEVTKQDVGLGNVENEAQVKRSEMGIANGVATLDAQGLVPSSQLPSYVDDVLEYSSLSSFPETGEDGKIYIATDTNLQYRWSGTKYVEISPSLALGETAQTAYPGNKGKQNADDIADIKKTYMPKTGGTFTGAVSSTSYYKAENSTLRSSVTVSHIAVNVANNRTNSHTAYMDGQINIKSSTSTTEKTIKIPDKEGTIALVEDIPTEDDIKKIKVSDAAFADEAGNAATSDVASELEHSLQLGNTDEVLTTFSGIKNTKVEFYKGDFHVSYMEEENLVTFYVELSPTGVAPGTYSAVTVDHHGRVTEGSQVIEWGKSGQTTPTSSLVVGGLFFELQS